MSVRDDQAAKALYAKNLKAFARFQPKVLRSLPFEGQESGVIQFDEQRPSNINILGAQLYPEPAFAWSSKQVEAYLNDPDQLTIPDPLDERQPEQTHRLADEMARFAKEKGFTSSGTRPLSRAGFTFVFGVGLGYHLMPLLEKCPSEQIVIVEPVPEFLKHSMFAFDWECFFERAVETGTAVHFKIGLTPERFMLEVEGLIIHSKGARFIDGTHAFVHYPSWQIIECRKLLNERIGNFLIRPGHFGDEKIMMENAVENLMGRPFHLIEGHDDPSLESPVFVVGSGPSLDDDLENIKSLRNKALIASCGSSLGILLKNGIKPDFHLENENTLPLVRNLRVLKERFDLAGMTLIASATVNREVGEMFDKNWFYFRSTLSPAAILASHYKPVGYAGPLVANAALAALSSLGLRRFFLFGIDCGRQAGGLHHSKDAVYYESGYDNFIEGEGHEYLEGEFTRSVPGNFGGRVATSAYYDLSRRTLTELIRSKNLDVVNCSRGAQINGAKPVVSGGLTLPPLEANADEIISRAEAGLRVFGGDELVSSTVFDHHINACDAFRRAFVAFMAEKDKPRDYIELQRRLDALMGQGGKEFLGLSKLVDGSILSLMRVGGYRGVRFESEEERQAMFEFFLMRFATSVMEMLDEVQAFLVNLKKRQSTLAENINQFVSE